jgi:hypothetical protein
VIVESLIFLISKKVCDFRGGEATSCSEGTLNHLFGVSPFGRRTAMMRYTKNTTIHFRSVVLNNADRHKIGVALRSFTFFLKILVDS